MRYALLFPVVSDFDILFHHSGDVWVMQPGIVYFLLYFFMHRKWLIFVGKNFGTTLTFRINERSDCFEPTNVIAEKRIFWHASLTLHLRPISHENDKLQQNDSTIYRMLIKCFCMSQMLNSCYFKLHSWLLGIKFPYKYEQIEKANKNEKNSE